MLEKFVNIFKLNPDYDKRVFGLDLMRAFAIIVVVMGHELVLHKAETDFPWIRLPHGVELFFVLSGFLIGKILIETFSSSETFGIRELGAFWIRRWFRTLPNYYLILLLNVVVVYFGIIKEDITQFNWKFFLFLQNFVSPSTGFFWESWSICVEEWFYLLFPVILSLSWVLLKPFNIGKKLVFCLTMVLFLLIPFLLRYFYASKFDVDNFWLWFKILKVVIYRLDGIALGVLAAFIKYYWPGLWHKSRNVGFIAGLIITYIVLNRVWLPTEFSSKVYRIVFEDIGCFLLLPKFDSMRKAPVVVRKIVTHISLISYSMYLINLALVSEVIRDNFPPQGPYSAWALYIVYWVAVLVFSTLLYKYYEKPFMDLRDKPFFFLGTRSHKKIVNS